MKWMMYAFSLCRGPPCCDLFFPNSFLENKTELFIDRYQTSTLSPGERTNEPEVLGSNLSQNCHSTSTVLTPSEAYATTYPSPESVIRHPVKLKGKHRLGPSNTTVTPILLSFAEKDIWNRVSKARMNMDARTVKRSASTPNVQQVAAMSTNPTGPQLLAEKRRNKLGYHRTSVACGMFNSLNLQSGFTVQYLLGCANNNRSLPSTKN